MLFCTVIVIVPLQARWWLPYWAQARESQVSSFWTAFIFEFTESLTFLSLSLFSNLQGHREWFVPDVLFCFHFYFNATRPRPSLPLLFFRLLPAGEIPRSANGLFESFILFSLLV